MDGRFHYSYEFPVETKEYGIAHEASSSVLFCLPVCRQTRIDIQHDSELLRVLPSSLSILLSTVSNSPENVTELQRIKQ